MTKWIIIQTNLAHWPRSPLFSLVEATGWDELQGELDKLERNDAQITAVPYEPFITAAKMISLGVLADDIYELADALGALDPAETTPADRCRKDFRESILDLLKEVTMFGK